MVKIIGKNGVKRIAAVFMAIYYMGCSIWAVNATAFFNDDLASIAYFHLGASVAVS